MRGGEGNLPPYELLPTRRKKQMERIRTDTLHFCLWYGVAADALALPSRVLSSPVTERALHPLLYDKINLCAHAVKVFINILIGEAQNI